MLNHLLPYLFDIPLAEKIRYVVFDGLPIPIERHAPVTVTYAADWTTCIQINCSTGHMSLWLLCSAVKILKSKASKWALSQYRNNWNSPYTGCLKCKSKIPVCWGLRISMAPPLTHPWHSDNEHMRVLSCSWFSYHVIGDVSTDNIFK